MSPVGGIAEDFDAVADYLEELTTQRDTLLEACKRAVNWINQERGVLYEGDPNESAAPKFLHAAIEMATPDIEMATPDFIKRG